jgi:hypothetical protein
MRKFRRLGASVLQAMDALDLDAANAGRFVGSAWLPQGRSR